MKRSLYSKDDYVQNFYRDLFESWKTVQTLVPRAIEAKDALVTARVKFPFTSSLVISHCEVA